MDILLTPNQQQAIKIAKQRYDNKEPYTCIAGYAGTGKTSCIKYIIDTINIDESEVAFTSYTGKAVQVLKNQGFKNTMTTHQLMYKAKRLPNGSFAFTKRGTLNGSPKLVIVDEISMLPLEMWEQLLTYKIHVICLGDPFQLPPIKQEHDILNHPHIFLNEIHRQAKDNEIIYNSMLVRKGETLPFFQGENMEVISSSKLTQEKVMSVDQVLCATNKTRLNFNHKIRKILGYDEEITDGDRIICTQNYWRMFSTSLDNPLINGTIGVIQHPFVRMSNHFGKVILGNFVSDEFDHYTGLELDWMFLHHEQPCITFKEAKRYNIKWDHVPLYFSFAYAITCHKAQGSQWDSVLITEERFPFSAEEHARWLYTAITRASKKCIVARNF